MSQRSLSADKRRFVVEWVSGDSGVSEPTPDDFEYSTRECSSLEQANTIGERESRVAGICYPWWRVSEEVFDPNYYGPGASGWETVRQWVEGQEVRL